MRFGSVCSGIEAASVAWGPLGWTAAWFSEIEPFPCAVLKHHYPDVPNLGDMTKLPDLIRSGQVEVPDILCGGTPCQAFSVAGLRQSLDDERGNLSLTFCEIADAIDEQRKSIIFWENVPGVLSTKDNAFGCFLGALAGEDDALVPPGGRWANAGFVDGPKRAVAWRVLDAQYFGVAQRRRRVFVVASARADFDPAAVLFEFDGVRRDSAPSRETGKAVAGTIEASLGRSRGAGTPTAAICPTLRAGGNRTGGDRPPSTDVDTADSLIVQQPYAVGNTLTARMHKGINSTLDEGQTPVVVHGTQDPCVSDIAFAQGRNNGGENVLLQTMAFQQTADCLTSAYGTKWNGNASATNGSLFAAQPIIGGVDYENNAHGPDDVTGPLLKGSPTGGGRPLPAVATAMQVRRLTPVECERLQGFPDNYTDIKDKCPDGPRYKALGNSWAVPVVRWIGERIDRALG
jgi:DNA (cytosine-5)-methyltransferase 1